VEDDLAPVGEVLHAALVRLRGSAGVAPLRPGRVTVCHPTTTEPQTGSVLASAAVSVIVLLRPRDSDALFRNRRGAPEPSRKPLVREPASRVPTGVAQARLRARLCSISTVRRPGDCIPRRAASRSVIASATQTWSGGASPLPRTETSPPRARRERLRPEAYVDGGGVAHSLRGLAARGAWSPRRYRTRSDLAAGRSTLSRGIGRWRTAGTAGPWSPVACRRALACYPSTLPGGPPSDAISAEKYSPAALGMLSCSWVGLHCPVLAA